MEELLFVEYGNACHRFLVDSECPAGKFCQDLDWWPRTMSGGGERHLHVDLLYPGYVLMDNHLAGTLSSLRFQCPYSC